MCTLKCGLCRKKKEHYNVGDLVQVKVRDGFKNAIVSKRCDDRVVTIRYADRSDLEIDIFEEYLFYLNKIECPIVSSKAMKKKVKKDFQKK